MNNAFAFLFRMKDIKGQIRDTLENIRAKLLLCHGPV